MIYLIPPSLALTMTDSLTDVLNLPGLSEWVSGHNVWRCSGLDNYLKYFLFQELHLQAGRNQNSIYSYYPLISDNNREKERECDYIQQVWS